MTTPSIPLHQLDRHSDCTLCSLHTQARAIGLSTCHHPTSLLLDPSTPALLCLGQNPGYHEDLRGVPFIGKSGDMLRRAYLAGVELPGLASIWLANTARCFHREGTGPTNAHYKACRPYLIPDLLYLHENSSHVYVLCLGAPASTHLHALCGVPKVTLSTAMTHQGTTLTVPAPVPFNVTSFSTFHPAACLRTMNLLHAVAGHMQILRDHITQNAVVPSSPTFELPRYPIP